MHAPALHMHRRAAVNVMLEHPLAADCDRRATRMAYVTVVGTQALERGATSKLASTSRSAGGAGRLEA